MFFKNIQKAARSVGVVFTALIVCLGGFAMPAAKTVGVVAAGAAAFTVADVASAEPAEAARLVTIHNVKEKDGSNHSIDLLVPKHGKKYGTLTIKTVKPGDSFRGYVDHFVLSKSRSICARVKYGYGGKWRIRGPGPHWFTAATLWIDPHKC